MTTVQAIGILVMRVFALFIIVLQFPVVMLAGMQYFGPAEGGAEPSEFLTELLYQFGVLLTGVLLLFLSRPVARLIAPAGAPAQGRSPVDPEEMLSIGSFLIGVLLLVMRLPDVVLQVIRTAVAAMRDLDTQLSVFSLYWRDGWSLAEQALILIIAFWLVLRPASLSGLYRWLRTAGQPKTATAREASPKED